MSRHRWISLALLALAIVAGAGFALQRQAASALQQEIALLRSESRELERLRAENERLKAAQAPLAEVERLRADHTAMVRLRADIEDMKARADKRAR